MRVRRFSHTPPPRVRALMSGGAVTADREERLADAAGRMRDHQVGALAVVEADRLIGIITERDLLRALADGLSPRVTTVAACMTEDPYTVTPDDEATDAIATMLEHGVRHLPVVEEGHIVGFLSARDLLRLGRSGRANWRELTYEPW